MPDVPAELKVMSFNIRYGTASDGENSWPFRRDAVLDFLGTCGCDVIGLQEVLAAQLQEIRQALPHFHFVGVGRDDGYSAGEYAAILYDSRRIRLGSSETFWFSETPEVIASTSWGNELTRICTRGTFFLGELRFDVYNIHIDHESAISRLKSVELLVHRAGHTDVPVIVTGDFNEGESGPAVDLIIRSGFLDTYRAMNPDGPEQASYHGWTNAVDGDKIDYVFVTSGWSIVDATIIRDTPYGRFLSDHYPVKATLEFS